MNNSLCLDIATDLWFLNGDLKTFCTPGLILLANLDQSFSSFLVFKLIIPLNAVHFQQVQVLPSPKKAWERSKKCGNANNGKDEKNLIGPAEPSQKARY